MQRPFAIAAFLFVAAGILALGDVTVYEALRHGFHLTRGPFLYSLLAVLVFLTFSFIVSTLLGMRWYNAFTRVYYFLSSIWIGTFLYLFLASLVYALVALLLPALSLTAPYLFGAAVIASVYAFLHARQIRVREISVTLPRLPDSWKGRTAVWISDVHLGQIYGVDYSEQIVARVEGLRPDLIFVGGDLYDGTGAPDIPELTAPLANLRAPLGTYFITGNHEEFGNLERFLSAVKSVGMRVLMDEKVEIDGVELIGLDYSHSTDADRFRKILGLIAPDEMRPSILLKHEPKDLAIAEAAGVSLVLSGHTHNAQLWPLSYIARMTYGPLAYGLHRMKRMLIYTSSGTGTWGPPMRLGSDCEIVRITFA